MKENSLMKHLLRLADWSEADIIRVFDVADNIKDYQETLSGKTAILFFPPTSLLTRTTFEMAVANLNGNRILFPNDMLDRWERLCDSAAYLSNWADVIIARTPDTATLHELVKHGSIPVINAMTSDNHPCEILSDLYALSKMRSDWKTLKYLFVGVSGNIGKTWHEAAQVLSLNYSQSCPAGYEIEGALVEDDIQKAVANADIVLTDPLPRSAVADFASYQITTALMQTAHSGALLNPCPAFNRGEEVSSEVIGSPFFVGHSFKKSLVAVQQAALIHCLGLDE